MQKRKNDSGYLVALIFTLPLCLMINSSGKITRAGGQAKLSQVMLDTIEGDFLYEVNVPLKAYTRFDQIERGNNLIIYDSLFASGEVSQAYQKGIFILDYELIIQEFLKQHKDLRLTQDPDIWKFIKRVNQTTHQNDSLYMSTLYYDRSKIFSFKRIRAKLVVAHLGLIKQLIPASDNYKCCYTTKFDNLDTYFVQNVLEFKIIE
ncbi:MAG: hypothetical protein ABI480_16760 [Chitinophagaceae bacterium]